MEKQNEGLAFNVYGWERGDLTILWISSQSKDVARTNLLLVTDGEKSHYCWIKNLGRLLFSTKNRNRTYHCDLCLSRFSSEEVPKKHQEICDGVNGRPTRIDMPEKGKNILKFYNHGKMQKVPYMFYADFESIIEKTPEGGRTQQTEKTAKHIACGYAYTVVRSDRKSWSKKYRVGADGNEPAALHFLKSIVQEEEAIRAELEKPAPLKMSPEDWGNFKAEEECWICKEELTVENFLDS